MNIGIGRISLNEGFMQPLWAHSRPQVLKGQLIGMTLLWVNSCDIKYSKEKIPFNE